MHVIPSEHHLYLIGDYHSCHELLEERLANVERPASVVMLGDYGVVEAQDLVNLSTYATRYGVDFYLIRGNHDHPKYWQDRALSEVVEAARFKLLKDVDCLLWQGRRLLTVSGSVSVDRTCLRYDEGRCWPKTESIPVDAPQQVRELVREYGSFDILLSHTGIIDGMTIKNDFVDSYASTDENLYEDIKRERAMIEKLEVLSGCREHYYGHFHQSWRGESYGIQKRCLNICEMIEIKS
jgi:hypothetical protein